MLSLSFFHLESNIGEVIREFPKIKQFVSVIALEVI
jgi:hypothetical protein